MSFCCVSVTYSQIQNQGMRMYNTRMGFTSNQRMHKVVLTEMKQILIHLLWIASRHSFSKQPKIGSAPLWLVSSSHNEPKDIMQQTLAMTLFTQLRISPCSLEMHICAGRCQASIRQVSHWWSYLSQLKQHRLGPWSSTSRRREREEWRRKMEAGRGGERAAGNMWCTAPRSQPAGH